MKVQLKNLVYLKCLDQKETGSFEGCRAIADPIKTDYRRMSLKHQQRKENKTKKLEIKILG